MTTQAFEIQAVSDEELQAANGGRGGLGRLVAAANAPVEVPSVSIPSMTPSTSAPAFFRGSSSAADKALGLG